MNKRRGISLIVLVITILVMIILAGVVVVSLSKNNPIEKAKEATFKSNVASYLEELSMFHANQVSKEGYSLKDLNADKLGINYIGENLEFEGNITNIITAMKEKVDINNFSVMAGELVYIGQNKDEIRWCQQLGVSSASFVNGVNTPKLSSGMIPVYLDGNTWKKADASNDKNVWYNYDAKMWANAVTVKEGAREKYNKAPIGTAVAMDDINMFLVWIPRFAYSISGSAYKNIVADSNGVIDVKFLKGTTNQDKLGKVYPKDYDSFSVNKGSATPMIVHPAFTFGSVEVPGIWVTKFEVSGSADVDGKHPGNRYKASNVNAQGDYPYELKKSTENTVIQSIPGVPTMREINIYTFIKTVSDKMMTNQKKLYGTENMDMHLIKNTEWGAVEYLASSKYGQIPTINSEIKRVFWNAGNSRKEEAMVDVIAGSSNYIANASQSTTGNATGVYDMNGASWEFTTGYLANGLENDSLYGENIANIDSKYRDVYPCTTEEKNDRIDMGNGTFVNKKELVNLGPEANQVRKRIAKENLKLANVIKGDGLYEITKEDNFSYLGKASNNTDAWLSFQGQEHTRLSNWDKDVSCMTSGLRTYLVRGGLGLYGEASGIHTYLSTYGYSGSDVGFRIVII